MKKYYLLIMVVSGILLILAGAGYGVMFAGLPGPDDSPAESARVSLHGSIAFGGVCVGVLTLLAGVVAWAIRVLSRTRQPVG